MRNLDRWQASRTRTELVQVAAVAIAMVQDLDGPGNAEWAYDDVQNERIRQMKLWGDQHHPIERWMMILLEEVGEAAQAANDEIVFPRHPPQELLADLPAADGPEDLQGPGPIAKLYAQDDLR